MALGLGPSIVWVQILATPLLELEKMETYEQLKSEFQRKVKKLQEKCEHPEISDWMQIHWAIGHSTGNSARFCEICDRMTHWKGIETVCPKCGRIEKSYWIECPDCGIEMYRREVEINKLTGDKEIIGKIEEGM